MIIGRLEMVGFKVSLIFDIWTDIQVCGRMGLVILKVPSEDLERNSNCTQKVFDWMRHGGLVVGSSILEFLTEFL